MDTVRIISKIKFSREFFDFWKFIFFHFFLRFSSKIFQLLKITGKIRQMTSVQSTKIVNKNKLSRDFFWVSIFVFFQLFNPFPRFCQAKSFVIKTSKFELTKTFLAQMFFYRNICEGSVEARAKRRLSLLFAFGYICFLYS